MAGTTDAGPDGAYRFDDLGPGEWKLTATVFADGFSREGKGSVGLSRETGSRFDFDTNTLLPGDPLPEFLLPLRSRIAAMAGVEARLFEDALVSRYAAGTVLQPGVDLLERVVATRTRLLGRAHPETRLYITGTANPTPARP